MRTDDLQWISINDFSPGIRQRVLRQGGTVSPQPLGAAQLTNTYRCIALPGGGLGPLPRRTYSYSPTLPHSGSAVQDALYISGFHISGPVLNSAGSTTLPYEFHIAYEYIYDTGGGTLRRRYRAQRHRMFEASPTIDALKTVDGTETSPSQQYRGTFYADIRAHPSDATLPGFPLTAFAWYEGGGGLVEIVCVYPDPDSPTTTSTEDIATTLSSDYVVGHQGRLVILEQKDFSHGVGGTWSSNEQIYWTHSNLPDLVQTVGTPSVFGQETFTGIGVLASTSASELLLIKHKGGGYAVTGDLDNPTVVRLPAVVPTAGITCIPTYTPLGLAYFVSEGGVYVWGGGASSIPIANQLEDDFWKDATVTAGKWLNHHGEMAMWKDWLLVPNNWLCDMSNTQSPSWWKLDETTTVDVKTWQIPPIGDMAYGAPGKVDKTNSTGPVVYGWDRTEGAYTYSWQSQPIPQSLTRRITVRTISVRAHGAGTITITLTNADGTTQAESFTVASSAIPILVTKPTRVEGTHIIVRIQSNGTSDSAVAPIVYEVNLGVDEKQTAAA